VATLPTKAVLDRLAPPPDPGTDAAALARFARERDEAAFAHLVRRFGPLVMGVCRRVLGGRPEADDAFQATFWVLARRAGSIRHPRTLPAWLHAVALRTARRALRRVAPVVVPVADRPAADDPFADASWREVRQRLDDEVHRLPAKLRLPVVLCYFEELTRDEAADRLGWSVRTLKRRLEAARERLRLRLVRRGIGPGLLGTALLADRLTARVSTTLESTAIGVAHQAPSAAVRALAATGPGLKTLLAAAVAVAGLGWGIIAVAGTGTPPAPKDPPAKEPSAEAPKEAAVAESLPPGAVARIGTTRYRASSAFWYASFSADGRWLASGTGIGVEAWDLRTGVPRMVMPVRHNTVPKPTLNPDGSLVAVLDGGAGVHLFDRATGKELVAFGEGEAYNECRFSPDGTRVIAVRYRETPIVKGFDLRGKELFRRQPEGDRLGEWDGRLVFYAIGAGPAGDGKPGPITLRVVEVETGKELKAFATTADDYYVEPEDTGFTTGIRDSTLSRNRFAVAPDLSSVAYLRADLKLGVVSLAPGSKPRVVELPADFRPGRIWFGSDGKSLFTSNWGGAIARCDPVTGKHVATFRGHGNGVGQWHTDPAGKVMTTTGQDGRVARWDLTTNKEIPLATGGFQSEVHVAVTADGRVIAGDRSGVIEVCSAEGKPLYTIPGADGAWSTFAVSPDGHTLVVARGQNTLLWWDLIAGKELAKTTIPGPVPDQVYHSINDMAFTPDGRRLLCSLQDAILFAVDTQTRKELWRVGPPTDRDFDAAHGLTVSADSRHVARGLRRGGRTGDWGYALQVLDVATGQSVQKIDVSEAREKYGLPDLKEARYTSDGRFIVLVSLNGRVQLRHADTLALVSAWMAGSQYAISLGVSPDGRTVLTGDDAGTIKLWELLTGKLVGSVTGHRGTVMSVAAAPDGRHVASGGYDKVAYVWDLKPAGPAPANPVERLLGDDAAAARAAIWALAADPDGPRRLRERFPPVTDPKPDVIRGWIADLDHPTFARREAASKALTEAGVLVEPAVRAALAADPTPEARQRLEKIVKALTHNPTPADVRSSRAVHAMELANTAAARRVLEEWAGGVAGAWLTVDAKRTLDRLRARP
jgi:RNA polymerase sigma factor (sigma-70 family)